MASGKSKIHVRAKAQSLKPYEELEIIYNGKVVRSVRPSGDHFEAVIDEAVEVDRGGGLPRAHTVERCWSTAPLGGRCLSSRTPHPYTWICRAGRPQPRNLPASFLNQLDHLQNWMEAKARFPSQENKSEALARVAQAPGIYEKLAEVR